MFHAHKITGTFRPLQDWVILHPIKEDTTKGGILLPENVQHEYGRCEVMAVGPGYQPAAANGLYKPNLVRTELKVGQFVYVQRFVEGEMKLELNGVPVYAIRERHLNCTIEPASPPAKKRARLQAV